MHRAKQLCKTTMHPVKQVCILQNNQTPWKTIMHPVKQAYTLQNNYASWKTIRHPGKRLCTLQNSHGTCCAPCKIIMYPANQFLHSAKQVCPLQVQKDPPTSPPPPSTNTLVYMGKSSHLRHRGRFLTGWWIFEFPRAAAKQN